MNAFALLSALFGHDDAVGWDAAAWGVAPRRATFEPPAQSGPELVDELLSTSLDDYPHVSLIHAKRRIEPAAYTRPISVASGVLHVLDPGRVRALFLEGATIQLKRVERHSRELASFAAQLETELGFPLSINAFVSPPRACALPAHSDPVSTIVLQLTGEKRWEVGREPPPSRWLRSDAVILRPGDALYLPPRWQHRATSEGASVSLSVAVKEIADIPVAWSRRRLAIPHAARAMFDDERLRRDRFGLTEAFDTMAGAHGT